jgi:hypothetical protein
MAGGPASEQPGCFVLLSLFSGVAVAGWVVAILIYSLVVEQWALVAVRREFGYDIAFLWAPLFGLMSAAAACFWASRGSAQTRRTPLLAAIALIVAALLFIVFAGLGTIF